MIFFSQSDIFLVTGASSGIGQAIALLLNSLGASVIANGRDCKKLKNSKEKADSPDTFFLEPLDLVKKIDSLPEWVKSLREKYGKLRGLVPCAGYAQLQALREYDRVQANGLFDIHFHAPMLLARGFADRRNNIGRGAAIVFMGSCAAIARAPGLVMYGSAKGALLTASGILSKELAPQGIRVNSLAMAVIQTPMGDSFVSFLPDSKRINELGAYPFGLGSTADVAGMTAFLLSEQGRWITGQTIVMDGGRY